jgi:acyl carrier protein
MDNTLKVREFVTTNFYVPDSIGLADGTSLLESGIVDSTGMLEVIAFIEETFAVKVEDEEMVPENLDSIDNIVAFIAKKTT